MDPILSEYYDKRRDLIYESIRTITPLRCSDEYLNKVVGHFGPRWDLPTLQKFFFDPVNTYLHQLKVYKYGLGVSILLEGSGISLESYLPLIGQSEVLNISKQMLLDITQSQTPNRDVQVIGNVGVGLLTFSTHVLTADIIALNEEQKFEFLSKNTSTAFQSFFGNGLRLYWREQYLVKPEIHQYLQFAALVNLPVLHFPINLLLILKQTISQVGINNILQRAAEDFSVAIQLQSDLNAFLAWEKSDERISDGKFHLVCNYVSLFAQKKLNKGDHISNMSKELIAELIRSSGAIEFTRDQISNYLAKAKKGVSGIPGTSHMEKLLHSYLDYIVESVDKK